MVITVKGDEKEVEIITERIARLLYLQGYDYDVSDETKFILSPYWKTQIIVKGIKVQNWMGATA